MVAKKMVRWYPNFDQSDATRHRKRPLLLRVVGMALVGPTLVASTSVLLTSGCRENKAWLKQMEVYQIER